jgi:RNA polymerase sigma factor (sigma-70 family)
MFFDHAEQYERLTDKLKEAAANHSLEYLRYEQEIRALLLEMGLDFDDQPVFERLIEDMDPLWTDYVDLRNQLVSPYLRLVYTIASGYSQSDSQTLDNFQNGVIGLHRAYKCYTPTRFAAFALVAEQWINQSILLQLKTEVNFIKLPMANWHSYQKLEKIKAKLEQRTNREVPLEQVAREANMDADKVKKIYENIKLSKVLSLNSPTQNEEEQNDGATWSLESVVDPASVDQEIEIQNEYETVKKVVTQFDEEETTIFAFISGCLDLIDNTHVTHEEIEKEKIRQLGAKSGLEITFKV